MVEAERKHNSQVAAKSVLIEEQKRHNEEEKREQKKRKLEVFEHKKQVKKEWR